MIPQLRSDRPLNPVTPADVAPPAPATAAGRVTDLFERGAGAPAPLSATMTLREGRAASADPATLWGREASATYAVQPGDTLYGIAAKLEVPLQALIDANPQLVDPNRLEVGQLLQIPGARPAAIPVAPELAAAHRRFAAQLGSPTGAPIAEASGNLKQDFERGYLLRAPDGTVFARGLDNSELGRVDPVGPPPPSGVDAAALQWVNKTRPVAPHGYAPSDLVSVDANGSVTPGGAFQARAIAQVPLQQMIAAAAAEGLDLDVISAYRSYGTQQQVYAHWVKTLGQEQADRVSARPGHSEHQLGTTFDLNSLTEDFGATAEGRWVAANAHRFGFEISYPQGHEHTTGYAYEPWHVRFVGPELAGELHRTGETLEAYFQRTR